MGIILDKDVNLLFLNGKKFREGNYDKALIPVGSCENHGDHLPFGSDTIVSTKIAEEVAKRVKGAFVVPPLPYGMSEHYAMFPIAVSLKPETVIAVLRDVFESLYRHGIRKFLVINGHDGNIEPIEIAARQFKVQHKDARIAVLDAWWVTAGKLLPPDTFEVWEGLGHAGEGETSINLAIAPELVDMEAAKGVVPKLPEHIKIVWTFDELTPYGATGDPTKATKEKGEKMLNVIVDFLVKFIEEMDAKNWEYKQY